LPFLGMRIYPNRLRLQHGRLWRSRRRIRGVARQVTEGLLENDSLVASARACVGIVRFFGLRGLPVGA